MFSKYFLGAECNSDIILMLCYHYIKLLVAQVAFRRKNVRFHGFLVQGEGIIFDG